MSSFTDFYRYTKSAPKSSNYSDHQQYALDVKVHKRLAYLESERVAIKQMLEEAYKKNNTQEINFLREECSEVMAQMVRMDKPRV
jgi:hypothetical protein